MESKSAKQEFLDREVETNEDWVTQQLLVTTNKTKIAKIGRELKELHRIAYKSWARELTFQTMLEAVEKAYKLALTEKKEDADIQEN